MGCLRSSLSACKGLRLWQVRSVRSTKGVECVCGHFSGSWQYALLKGMIFESGGVSKLKSLEEIAEEIAKVNVPQEISRQTNIKKADQ
jgi:hypothetical protein|tara:strand:+ start:560 stop:823 length:264 start_codon:yes stop_codon:yes gene_type:complete